DTRDDFGSITLSIGASCYRPGEPLAETVRRADAALYQAKHNGRNRVVSETGGSQPAQASQNTAKPIDSNVTGTPARAYSAKPICTPKVAACSTTRMLARLPISSRLPES